MVRVCSKSVLSAVCLAAALLVCCSAAGETLLKRPALDISLQWQRKPDGVRSIIGVGRQVDTSRELGKIEKELVADPLKGQLEHARIQFERGDLRGTEKALEAFLDSVDAYYTRKMMPESTYRILQHNGQRILDGLPLREEFKTFPVISLDRAKGVYVIVHGEDKVAYEPPTNIDAVVAARVQFDDEIRAYRYSYSVTSLTSSKQNIRTFPVSYGYPVSMLTGPPAWLQGFYSGRPLCSWSHTPHSAEPRSEPGIPPGSTESGFGFASYGLPGIVDCYAQGYTPLMNLTRNVEIHEVLDSLRVFERRYVHGKTLGPVSSPDLDTPIKVIERLERYVDEALDIGWLSTGQVAESLRERLESVEKALESNGTSRAEDLLRDFIVYVEQKASSDQIKPEAADLFRINGQWILQASRDWRPSNDLAPLEQEVDFQGIFRYLYQMLRQTMAQGWIQVSCLVEPPELGVNFLFGLPTAAMNALNDNDRARAQKLTAALHSGVQRCSDPSSEEAKHAIERLLSTIGELKESLK